MAYIGVRTGLGFVLLSLAYSGVAVPYSDTAGSSLVAFGVLVGLLFFGLAWSAVSVRLGHIGSQFTFLQVGLDGCFATTLVGLTGGPLSPFLPVYFLNIFAAGWLLGGIGPLGVAAFDALLYVGVVMLDLAGPNILPTSSVQTAGFSVVTMHVFAFFLVGGLSSLLGGNLRRLQDQLAHQVEQTAALEEVHSLMLDDIRVGVLVADSLGQVGSHNPAASEILGEVSGRPVADLVGQGTSPYEWTIEGDGRPQVVRVSTSPRADGGQLVLVEDVSHLKAMETRVQRDERLSAVGRLAAGLAHEIRNPLASLSGSVQLLKERDSSPLHDIVLREVRRLEELVEAFLDTAGPMRLVREPAQVGDIVHDVATAFRNDARYQGRRVIRTRIRPVPEMEVDPARIRQVLWNLVLNAAHHTPDYGTVELGTRLDGADVLVWVEDNGVGIPERDRDRIFDPFYTTRSGGTGLGLANVERIVRGHGGQIELWSQPGSGTRFTLRFPLAGGIDSGEEGALG